VAVLTELPARTQIRFDDLFPPFGLAGRMFSRLRNEVLASLTPDDRVLVVAGASRGPASTLVAANLAAALGRGGSEVVLVCAHLPETLVETAPATRLLGVDATPGLSDVLGGKVELADAVQHAPRNPWLRVLTTGGTASAGGLLQSPALRETLEDLLADADYVVIEAPSTAASADAQGLARLADAAILAVELRRTSLAEVVDAAEQLRRVGTPLLGAVVLPRLPEDTPLPGGAPPNRPIRVLDPAAEATTALIRTGPDATATRVVTGADAPTARIPLTDAATTRIPLTGAATARIASRDSATGRLVGAENPTSVLPALDHAGRLRQPPPTGTRQSEQPSAGVDGTSR
jgi:hypothetical protein